MLAPIDSTKTIPDSLVITRYIAQRYPSLIPESHAEQINSLLAELHEINFFSLTFTGQPEGVQARKAMLEKKLGESISDRYREAIKSKLKRYDYLYYPSTTIANVGTPGTITPSWAVWLKMSSKRISRRRET